MWAGTECGEANKFRDEPVNRKETKNVKVKILRWSQAYYTIVWYISIFSIQPFGAKEAGEGLTNPTAGPLSNVVFHATGISIENLPITPGKVLNALKKKKKKWRRKYERELPVSIMWKNMARYHSDMEKVSRPGSFTPAPLRTVREPLDSYRSRHPNIKA